MAPQDVAHGQQAVKKVPLRSDVLPELKIMTVVRVTIGQGGQIKKRPKKFYASQKGRDIVTWDLQNTGFDPISVTISDFLRRVDCSDDEGTVPCEPFIWLNSDTVTLDPGAEGFIDGRVNPAYQRQNPDGDDCLSYSIIVESKAATPSFQPIDYDPDGDIKP